jgi:signal peptidase II
MSSNPSPEKRDTAEQETSRDDSSRPGGLAWLLIVSVAAVDQLSKWVMLDWLPQASPRQQVAVIDGLLNFRLEHNTGVAFSLFRDHPGILTFVTSAAVIIIGAWAWTVPRADRASRSAFGLILGGAVGNLIDRHWRGHVIDFIDFVFPGVLGEWHAGVFGSAHFATFNLADAAICIGMVVLIAAMFFQPSESDAKETTPGGAPSEKEPAP